LRSLRHAVYFPLDCAFFRFIRFFDINHSSSFCPSREAHINLDRASQRLLRSRKILPTYSASLSIRLQQRRCSKATMADETYKFELYRYTPSRVAAVIFVVLFALTTAVHLFQLIKRRTWYFIPFVLGGCCKYNFSILYAQTTKLFHCRTVQVIGYVARVLAHKNKESIPLYSVQAIFILLAPALYAASIYMVLGRLIVTESAQDLSIVPVKWMTKIFIVGDIIGFLAQAAGMFLAPYCLWETVRW